MRLEEYHEILISVSNFISNCLITSFITVILPQSVRRKIELSRFNGY